METSPSSFVANRGAVASVPATGSPMTIANTGVTPMLFITSGGTVTTISLSPDGTNFYLAGLLAGAFLLFPGWSIRIAYVLAPTMPAIS
jgi:hypothetical protein